MEFSDIDYDEAQYIKFIIDADKNFDIVLYMKDNDNNTFKVRYQTENNEDTGDYKDDSDDNDELAIFLDEDEYVTGDDETFNSFTHGNSLSFDEYINTHWKKHEYNGGSAELEKIRIYGDEFKLYYIAIDDGDFTNPTWELDVSDENWDDLSDFENDGHSRRDVDKYTTIPTDIAFLGDYIYVTRELSAASGYFSYEGFPVYWNQPFYAWNQPYFGWNQSYSYGWNRPSYGWNQPYYGYQQSYNFYGYPWADQPPYGYRPWYYQPPTLANDFGGYPFGYQQTCNYGLGPSIGPGYPGYGFVGYPYGYGSAPYPYY